MKAREAINWMKANPGVTIPLLAFMAGVLLGALVF